MNSSKITKCCFIAAAIALLAVFVAVPAGAGGLDRRLYGDYTYNVAATCAYAVCGPDQNGKYDCQSTPGLNPDNLVRLITGRSQSYNVLGVIHFDGHGKSTLKGEVMTVRISPSTDPVDIPATQSALDCVGTYVVDSEGNELFVDITFTNCTGKIKQPAILGAWEFNLTGSTTVRGRLDTVTGSSTVIISNTLPYIEELEYTAGPASGMKEQRICNNMGTIVKLSPWHWFSK